MAETQNLPVLPLSDEVVLPGMVAPIALDGEAQAAVDAARSAADGKVVLVPRIDGAYGAHGVIATVEQVGRLPGGEPAAVLRARERGQIGTGVAGAGAALWVQVTPIEESVATLAPIDCRRGRARTTSSAQCWMMAPISCIGWSNSLTSNSRTVLAVCCIWSMASSIAAIRFLISPRSKGVMKERRIAIITSRVMLSASFSYWLILSQ